MRTSVLLTAAGMLGMVAGGWLIGQWAVGVAIAVDSLALVGYGLLRDVPERPEPSGIRRRAS